jgi:hypothetical protein
MVVRFEDLRRGPVKIIALEEHYGLPVIYEAAHKANDGAALALDVLGCVLIKSALGVGASDVCFSPNSGAKPDIAELRLRAIGRHCARGKFSRCSDVEPANESGLTAWEV